MRISDWSSDVCSSDLISETIEVRDGAGVSSAGGKLNGTALFALDSEGDDAYIVADSGGRLHLVVAKASGLKAIALPTIDRTRSVGELRFDGARTERRLDGHECVSTGRSGGWAYHYKNTE